MSLDCAVRVRFCKPSVGLRRYFTSFYLTEIATAPGKPAIDYLHPEWGNLRLISGELPEATTADGLTVSGTPAVATGPTASAIRIKIGTQRCWGIGFLPLGWAKFIDTPANKLADKVFDADGHPNFAALQPLIDGVFGNEPDEEAELARIDAHFTRLAQNPLPDEARIVAVHEAMVNSDVGTVAAMAEVSGLKSHTLERICRRHFGFAPQLLLRRQRFMRSVVQFMLDPSLKWIGAIDSHYHDQAQFVRDFRHFMGMSPREYAGLDHPILEALMRQRAVDEGAAVQALHLPRKAG